MAADPKVYFANLDGAELVEALEKRVKEFDRYMEEIGRVERIRVAWEYAHGLNDGAAGIRKAGKMGEILKVSVNNFRAFANNIHVLLTQAKSYYECQSVNGDYKSQAECVLGKDIVDYYNDERNIGPDLSIAAFNVLLFAEVFYELDWDESAGEELIESPDVAGMIENQGDVVGKLHNGLNVIRDINLKRASDSKWCVVRDFADKFDLAATYPEFSDHILSQAPSRQETQYRGRDSIYQKIRSMTSENESFIEVWRLYHEKTRAVKRGREALVVGGKLIFARDLTENYGEVPVKRFAASDIEGTFLAYSPLWDIIPLCQASDHMTTAQITNAINLAFTHVWSPDPKLEIRALTGGTGRITSQIEPKAINLGKSSPELGSSLQFLQQKAQFLTGINSVAAGQPEAVSNIKSGNGLALILSTAVQFQHIMQERYAAFRSSIMGLLIKILQKKATMPMLIAVSGKGKVRYAKQFKREDILNIRRVKCTVSSPIMATLGGRVQVADNLAAKFPNSVTPDQYIAVMETGNLDHIESAGFNLNMTLKAENEALSAGKRVPVNRLENHQLHIQRHLEPISTPDSKDDPKILENFNNHILEHVAEWRELTIKSPELLAIIGIPPLAMPPPPAPTVKNAGDASDGVPEIDQGGAMPSMPTLPGGTPEGIQAAYEQVNQPPRAPMLQ